MTVPAPEVKIIIQRTGTNSTQVLYGHVVSEPGGNASKFASSSQKAYDAQGAMMYALAVLLVYSISIFLLIIMLSRRKSRSMNLETEVNNYLKGLEYVDRKMRQEEVLYARYKIPGNFVGMRSETRLLQYLQGVETGSTSKSSRLAFKVPDKIASETIEEEDEGSPDLEMIRLARGRSRRQVVLPSDDEEDSEDGSCELLPAITSAQLEELARAASRNNSTYYLEYEDETDETLEDVDDSLKLSDLDFEYYKDSS